MPKLERNSTRLFLLLARASGYSSTLVSIPAPGTGNNDHNPPRIQHRSLFDASIGDDNLFKGDTYK